MHLGLVEHLFDYKAQKFYKRKFIDKEDRQLNKTIQVFDKNLSTKLKNLY